MASMTSNIGTGWFISHQNPEISWIDFLKIGEPQEPEIDLEEVEFPIRHIEKEQIVGIKMRVNEMENANIRNLCPMIGIDMAHESYGLNLANSIYLCIRFKDLTLRKNITERSFLHNPCLEITAERFLNCKSIEEVLNINTEKEMSEVTLRCSKEPKNAKNLTVGTNYQGILITKDGDQVDTIRDAHYFMCTNNSGNEARYSIGLFGEPKATPRRRAQRMDEADAVIPPPPPFPSFNNYISDLIIHVGHNGQEITAERFGNGQYIALIPTAAGAGTNYTLAIITPLRTGVINTNATVSRNGVNISCGISQIYGISSFWPNLTRALSELVAVYRNNNVIVTEEQIKSAKYAITTAVLKRLTIDANSLYSLLSSNDNAEGMLEFMETIDENHGEMTGVNPNSGNQIWLWTFKPER